MTESNASAVSGPAVATLSYEAEAAAAASKAPGGRLVSLDAFRGFIMMMLISSAFGLVSLQAIPPSAGWAGNSITWSGPAWSSGTSSSPRSCSWWGWRLAMPFAFGRRAAQGESFGRQFRHCVYIVFTEMLHGIVGTFTRYYVFLGRLGPIAQCFTVFLVMWYLCYWLYQRKIFFKI